MFCEAVLSIKLFPEEVWVKPFVERLLIVFGGIVIVHEEAELDMGIIWFDMVSEQFEEGMWAEVFPVFGLNTGAGRAGWGCNIAKDDDIAEVCGTDGIPWSNGPLLCMFILAFKDKMLILNTIEFNNVTYYKSNSRSKQDM